MSPGTQNMNEGKGRLDKKWWVAAEHTQWKKEPVAAVSRCPIGCHWLVSRVGRPEGPLSPNTLVDTSPCRYKIIFRPLEVNKVSGRRSVLLSVRSPEQGYKGGNCRLVTQRHRTACVANDVISCAHQAALPAWRRGRRPVRLPPSPRLPREHTGRAPSRGVSQGMSRARVPCPTQALQPGTQCRGCHMGTLVNMSPSISLINYLPHE